MSALAHIAESMVKAVGIAGLEAMAMKKTISSVWKPLADSLVNEVLNTCFDYTNEEIRMEYIDAIYSSYRPLMTADFVEQVAPLIYEYAGHAWDRGRDDALGSTLAGLVIQKDQEAIISDLVRLTGSSKENVQRTIRRWFKETQGEYFDRFIVPETARLLSYGEGVSLRSIGERYKTFVQADGYWSSVSEFNSETSKIFAQVQTLHELNVTQYTIEAVLDKRTCGVCSFLHGSTWSVEEAVVKMFDMLIAEADSVRELNPFPPRSTPKDFDDPHDSPYGMPPYHPRCRCNIRSTSKVTAMPSEVLARPFDQGKKPTDKLLDKVYTQYVKTPNKKQVQGMIGSSELPNTCRALTNAEKKIAKEAWEDIPFEIRKWASRNKETFQLVIEEGDVVSRVEGNRIIMNAKFFDPSKYGPQPLQHELRHALVNPNVIEARGGGDTIWRTLTDFAEDKKKGFRLPRHVNSMYQVNGGRGALAARAASDEFLAMIGDYYEQGMSLDDLIKQVRHKQYGIGISDRVGITTLSKKARWSAKEAKAACEYWWTTIDVDNSTLLSKKQLLAKLSHKPSNAQVQAIALKNELSLRDYLRAAGIKDVYQEGDNAPFDVWIGVDPAKYYAKRTTKKPKIVIEVKSIIRAKNDKITMHKDSLARKRKEWKKFGKRKTQVYTVVFDERTGKMYLRDDVGSFRLGAMKEVTMKDIQRLLGGQPTDGVLEMSDAIMPPPSYTSYNKAKKASAKYFKDNDYGDIVDQYVGVDAYAMNRKLRSSKNLVKAFDDPEYGLPIEVLHGALEEAPSYKGKVYRGLRFDNKKDFNAFKRQVDSAIKKDNPLLFRGFTSTSPNKENAYRFLGSPDIDNVLIEIKSKRGVVLEGASRVSSEGEVLLNAHSKFRVIGFEKRPHPFVKGKHYWSLQLEEVTDFRAMPSSTETLAKIRSTNPKMKSPKSSELVEKDVIDAGNLNEVRIVTVGKGRKKYIFKPIEGESFYDPDMVKEARYFLKREYPDVFIGNNQADFLQMLKNNQFPQQVLEYLEENGYDLYSMQVRWSITNHEVTLTQREAFSLDVAHRLGFNNENAIVPKFMIAQNEDGSMAGVLIEYIANSKNEVDWAGRQLTTEEAFQMAIFDYIIGNTDRHKNNWMRKIGTRKGGRPVYIDHGYVMAGQSMDNGGLTQWRCHAIESLSGEDLYDFDPDWIEKLAVKISNFSDRDAMRLARQYGFDDEEIDAMMRRLDSVVERLWGARFSDIFESHKQNGFWGVQDSFIG